MSFDPRRESLVRVVSGYVRDLGSPEEDPDSVFVASRKAPIPTPARVVLYNEGFTGVISWRGRRGEEKTCLVSVVPAHRIRQGRT